MPFSFLASLQKQFLSTYSTAEVADAPPYGMNAFSSEISRLMKQFEESPPVDPVKSAQAELANVKDIMVKNLDAVLARGETMDLLMNKTQNMSTQARAFRKRSTALRRSMWWKNTKVTALMGVSGILLFYFFVASFCGFGISHCRS